MRPTFDRRLWILLYWIFILQCISPTDQQIISQKASGQKTPELADTRERANTNIKVLSECANCNQSSATYKNDRKPSHQSSQGVIVSGKEQKPHQHRHQPSKFHDGQQVNNVELPAVAAHKGNVEHDGDSLGETFGAYRHSSHHHHHPAIPSQAPSPSIHSSSTGTDITAAAALNRLSEIRYLTDNGPRKGQQQQQQHQKDDAPAAAAPAPGFIDVSLRKSTENSSENHFLHSSIFHKSPLTSVLGSQKISSDTPRGNRHANLISGLHDDNNAASRVRREAARSSSVLKSPSSSSSSAAASSPSDDVSREQSNAFSSSDISKSDIRYNKTLSPNLNPSSIVTSASKGVKSSELFVPQLPSPLPKTDVSNLTLSAKVDKSVIGDSSSRSRTPHHAHSHNKLGSSEPIIIIDDVEEFESGISSAGDSRSQEEYAHDEPRVLPLRPIIRGPYDDEHDEEMSVVYAEQHTEIKLTCEVDLDVATSVWFKNGQIVHATDRTARVADYRFIREPVGALTITNVMLEDDGKWQCEAENARGYVENARPVKLVVLDRPKPPYLLIDSRRLDAGNIFVPVKENSELSLACVSEGGNPRPTLTWEVLLSPGVDRHAQKVAAEVLELEEIKSEKEKGPYKINSGAKSEARLPAVYRAHHNARILCVMEHPTLKMRQNASLLLDVQYTPSFAISRTPGFGYPLREGIEVSLKCDVDSNPPSTPRWQKDDGDTPVPQTGDGFLNFTSIRREHSGWYKCTSRHLNFQYSSIGYYLSVRYDSVDVTSEPDDQEVSVAASHNPNKGQLEVQLGGAVTLQCPQGSLGCWSHLDPMTARLRGLGVGLSTPTGQFSLKDVVYQDAGTYKCIGQSPSNKKKLEVLQTVGVLVKGAPTVSARNATPVAYPGSPLHLTVEFCANPAAYAARWLHGDRVYTPGNQYGTTVLAYGVTDLPTPFCKEARLTYVSMHERVPRTFYFIVSSPGGVAEAIFKVNFTLRYRTMSNSNSIDDEEEELSEPEEIHFPVFGNSSPDRFGSRLFSLKLLLLCIICIFMDVFL